MSERVTWITFEGKRLLFIDFGGIKTREELQSTLNVIISEVNTQPKNSILYLVNMENGYVTPQVMPMYKESAQAVQPYIKAWAMFGINRIKAMIVDLLKKSISLDAEIFQSRDDACNWLINQ